MAERIKNIDRETPMLFPVDMRDWVPANHLVHFIIGAVESLELSKFKVNRRGSGDEQYPPAMMLGLLLYCYATGTFSSRKIQQATYENVAVRYLCGGVAHPDYSVICDFRRNNREAIKEAFTKVLLMARESGQLKKVGGISVDGTKVKANASKHHAVSYRRAVEMIAELEGEVVELMVKAEEADSRPLKEGLEIPKEIQRREELKATLLAAKAAMEKRYAEAEEEARKEADEPGKSGKPAKPLEKYQENFTDPESRIMKAGNGAHFEQCYNAQAAVDTEGSMLILGGYVTNHGNDKKELAAVVGSVDSEIREVSDVSADTGFYSEEAVKAVEQRDEAGVQHGPTVYCAVEKQRHHRTVKDLEQEEAAPLPKESAGMKEKMAFRLKSEEGRAKYKKRKETVEPVFGIIKSVMGFRQFMLRGLAKVSLEWELIMTAYNFKRLHRLMLAT